MSRELNDLLPIKTVEKETKETKEKLLANLLMAKIIFLLRE